MNDWLRAWNAGLLGTVGARALFEQTGDDEMKTLIADRDRWPPAWRTRFAEPSAFRQALDEAERALNAMPDAVRASLATHRVDALFPEASHAFRTPFVQTLGDVTNLGRDSGGGRLVRVAIVGTRRIPAEDCARIRQWLERWLREEPALIVSGGAFGVDAAAHEAALGVGAPTWCIQAGGLAAPAPSGNRRLFRRLVASGGALISERAPHVAPRRHDFLARNRLIAALADVVVVARAPARSGALSTAREAKSLRRPLYVIPGNPDDAASEGSNALLRGDATPLSSLRGWRQLIDEARRTAGGSPGLALSEEPTRSRPDAAGGVEAGQTPLKTGGEGCVRAEAPRVSDAASRTDEDRALYALLRAGPSHHDALLARWRGFLASGQTNLPLSAALLDAELRGLVARLPGNEYRWR